MKAGQFVASLKQVPQEYSLMLSSLQDQVLNFEFLVNFDCVYCEIRLFICCMKNLCLFRRLIFCLVIM